MPLFLLVASRSSRVAKSLLLNLLTTPARAVFTVGMCAGFLVQPPPAAAQNQCLTLPIPAECESLEFQAIVTSVVDPDMTLGDLFANDTISGTMTINRAVTDTDPGVNDGSYPNAIQCIRIDLADRSLVFSLDPTLPIEDRRMEVVNDRPSMAGGFTLFSDVVAASTGGFAIMDIDALPAGQDLVGAAAFSYAYDKSCIQTLQSPCPPILLSDDSIPSAPGDVTALDTTPLNFRFADFSGTGMLALVGADLTNLDPSAPIPCPEPGFALSLSSAVTCLGFFARRRRRLVRT